MPIFCQVASRYNLAQPSDRNAKVFGSCFLRKGDGHGWFKLLSSAAVEFFAQI
jgi:hypothetical protein